MNRAREITLDPDRLPAARPGSRKPALSLVWLAPVIAALVTGYLLYRRVQARGPEITLHFRDASNLRRGETTIKYRGVTVGEITTLELSPDHQKVVIKARLRRTAKDLAREGSVFWIVRPEVGLESITGLGTIIAGPYIEVFPGSGPPVTEFVGLDYPPASPVQKGLGVTLVSSHLGSLKRGSPVYYRGIQVGAVGDTHLGTNATNVNIRLTILPPYTNLVHRGSKFWNVSGVDVKVGLFRGVDISVESLRSLVIGGVTFATPDDPKDKPAQEGATFLLHAKPENQWLE
jgi:paraquat-inducible protein B